METPDLTSDAFWLGGGIHVALPPGLDRVPPGLVETAAPHLLEGGCLFRTSGTTAEPKWVALEKRAFLHSARVVNAHYDLTEKDRWLITLPEHHVGGFSIYSRAWLSASEIYFLREKWNLENFILSLRNHFITVTSIVPTQLHDIVTAKLPAPDSLRLVIVGGGKIEPDLMRQALALGWNVCATYGMTETASQVASQPLEHNRHDEPETLEVLPHWDAQVNENDTLILRGPALAKGYIIVTQKGAHWEPIHAETGFVTRDRVRLWRHGTRTFLRFIGREHSFVKVLGGLIHLDTLEQRLRNDFPPNFSEVAVLALPDPRREHRLVLVIESATLPPGLDQVLQTFHQTCAPYERIQDCIPLPSFPRSDLGKLSRETLQRLLG